jgi:FAD/FMN-containing dehydrogenase
MTTITRHTSHDSFCRQIPDVGVVLADDDGYDQARQPWNVAVDQRPAAVVYPTTAAQIAAVVRAADDVGLRVAPQGTGHNAGPLPGLDDVVLLRTSHMRQVTIDRGRGIARVESGALWLDVTEPAGRHGFAALHGSSPDVGVAGYSLGGGIGWYARQHGLQTNSVTAVELVLADGRQVRADAEHEQELFWAVRGGSGNFGVVTALEFRLYPIRTAYAGFLAWEWNHAPEVLRRYAEWAPSAPDEVTTSVRLLQLPPIPDIPEPMRGRQLVMIDGAVLGDDDGAQRVIAPLRELRPEVDTFGQISAPALVRLHMDPEGPTPVIGNSSVLGGLPESGIDALLSVAGPGSGTSLLIAAELRQLGGALARTDPAGGALPRLDGEYALFTCGIAPTSDAAAAAIADTQRVVAALAPYANGRKYLNFVEHRTDPRAGYDPRTWNRLREIRAAVDPNGLFVANHPVPRA